MVNVQGSIQLLINGRVAAEFDNMLLEDFYNSYIDGAPSAYLSDNSTPPVIDETGINVLATSDSGDAFARKSSNADDKYLYSQFSTDLYFSQSFEGDVASIGLILGSTKISRALVRDEFGAVTTINVRSEDTVSIRYNLTYKVSREPCRVTLHYQGEDVLGTLTPVNPNKWGSPDVVPIAVVSHLSIPVNNLSADSLGYLPGNEAIFFDSESTGSNSQYSPTLRKDVYMFTIPQDVGVGKPIDQILFGVESGVSNGVLMLNLDESILKTVDDTLTVSLGINVEA